MERTVALAGKKCAVFLLGLSVGPALAATKGAAKKPPMNCSRAVFEGDVKAGEGFEEVFAPGLKFYLEPLRSGWIVRVLAADEPRGPHDYAELATPPYRSVSPLLLSTDWSFRAQDAVAWNPRRFRYAENRETFHRLAALYDKVMAGDAASASRAADLVSHQPEGVLQILDAKMAPGVADQAQMAATVASHLAETPHEVDQSATPSPLGRLEEMRFRVQLDLPAGIEVVKGIKIEKIFCAAQPAAFPVHPTE
jgi:hypothetical protein